MSFLRGPTLPFQPGSLRLRTRGSGERARGEGEVGGARRAAAQFSSVVQVAAVLVAAVVHGLGLKEGGRRRQVGGRRGHGQVVLVVAVRRLRVLRLAGEVGLVVVMGGA